MDAFIKWFLERGPVAALGAALLAFVVFHIAYTVSGNQYSMFGQTWGAVPPPVIVESDVPTGTIVSYFPVAGSSLPDGWAVCDGTNGTPDLRNKFIQGVASPADVGDDPNGRAVHAHTGQTSAAVGGEVYSTTQGNDDLLTNFSSHTHAFQTNEVSNIPPNFKLIYIMKLS